MHTKNSSIQSIQCLPNWRHFNIHSTSHDEWNIIIFERYCPKTITEFVFRNNFQNKIVFKSYISIVENTLDTRVFYIQYIGNLKSISHLISIQILNIKYLIPAYVLQHLRKNINPHQTLQNYLNSIIIHWKWFTSRMIRYWSFWIYLGISILFLNSNNVEGIILHRLGNVLA